MRGFCNARGISGRPFITNILILFAMGALLFSSGCSGLVSASGSGGNPGPLAISNVTTANATPTSVGIDWQTNAPANSQVEYGTTTSYGSTTTVDSTMVTSHQLTVSSLKPGSAYHCRVHSTDANNNSAVSGDMACPTSPDTTAPTVSITSPAANATISGTISLTASASDNVAVASVQFKVDNASTGAAITAAPYSYALNTATLSDGNHILTAVATDTSGNAVTSAGVAVKVNNATPGPSIVSLNPVSGLVGTSVTIAGANFGGTQGSSTVTFNGITATPASWSATSIVAPVPAGATTGNVVVTVGGVVSNGVSFTVTVPAPSITSLNPTSGLVGTSVTIAGANFGATQGASTVKFNGTAATPTSWSATSIVAAVPVGATTGNVVVTVGGVASNGVSFTVTVPAPSITSLNPTSGLVGTSVTIAGANFGATQGTSTVKFNGIAATPTSWSATSIVAPVPIGATTGNVVVTVGGVASNGVSFTVTVPGPSITSLNPMSGLVGAQVTIAGANFGTTQGTSTVKFNGITATTTSWSATSIVAPVPAGATTGNVVVTVGGVASNGVSFTVTVPAPSITSLNPTSGLVGAQVTIAGANFGTTQGTSTVKFNGVAAAATSWSATSIVAAVPAGATTGNVVVTVGGVASNGVSFTVTVPAPSITSLNPTSGLVGASVTITGANFGTTQGTSTVKFNGITATTTSWSATSIVAPVPIGATTGNVVVTVGGVASNGVSFTVTVPGPSITSLSPTSGLVGASVTITGANFGATQGTSTVKFNGITATTTSWSATSIVAPVPIGTATGNVVVTVGGVASNGVSFTVTVPGPSITSLNPTSGLVGASVTITGANFGATQGTSTVKFNGITATTTSWSATSIVAAVPAGATTGNVVVTVGGVASNGVSFTVTVPAPSITSLNPTSGLVGASVTITGANFGTTQGTSTVKFNGITATTTSWSATSIVAPVPIGATTGNVVVTVGGVASNGVSFTVTVPGPSITSLSPTSGLVGASVTITGANFGATQGTSTVKFNGITATTTSWSATSIVAPVPIGTATGNVVVTVGGVASNGVSFTVTVPGPSITSLNPTSGLVGASVTITGANFGATQGTSTVKFNGITATTTSWSATSIVAPVPVGATTGNVVVTVGGVASNGVNFTVLADTTAPVVTITAPANNATVSATITLTATATDPDSSVSFVQFLVDGTNTGARLTTSPYSISVDTTTLSNGAHTLTAVAQDPSANIGTSPAVTISVSNTTNTSMGPLKQSTVNTRYFVDPAGNAVFLSGTHTWDDFQDTDTNVGSTPGAFDFTGYVNFLKAHNHNATILWRKDLPEYCGWNFSGSTWRMGPWPWLRPGPGVATDGNPKFDLTQFNQAYFDRLRAEAQQLQMNGIYAIVELFDANQLTSARCSTDGYEFTGTNNINGADDGYTSGTGGTNSVTMTGANAISGFQDAYAKKVLDTLNDLPNVIYEVAEEQPAGSATWWFPHMISLVRSYESTKALQHPVGIGSMNATAPSDSTLYSSTADWIAPTINTNFSNQFPSNVAVNNQGKVVINDSDHSLGYKSFLNADGSIQDQNLRGYIWENITQGAEGLIFMDPYVIYWQGSPVRNTCLSPAHQVCTGGVDAKYDKFRTSMGFAQGYVNGKMDLLKATPQGSLSSTGFCLADNAATGAEYLVYAPSGGTFTVNLTATTRALNVEWFNPATGGTTAGAAITGGGTKSFTAPFSGDAVLYIVDAAGHN